MTKECETELQPSCYKRHAEIDGHMAEGKFWRGVIITMAVSGIGIFIGQYNMAVENNNRIIILTSKLATIAEANVKRLDRLEEMLFSLRGIQGQTGATGISGTNGRNGRDGKDA